MTKRFTASDLLAASRKLKAKGIPQPDADEFFKDKRKPGKKSKCPNKNELAAYNEYISTLDLIDVQFEGRFYKLHTIRYTPDWTGRRPSGTRVAFEVKPFYKNKGRVHWHPGSRERLKMAAAMYPDDEFYALWKDESGWQVERI